MKAVSGGAWFSNEWRGLVHDNNMIDLSTHDLNPFQLTLPAIQVTQPPTANCSMLIPPCPPSLPCFHPLFVIPATLFAASLSAATLLAAAIGSFLSALFSTALLLAAAAAAASAAAAAAAPLAACVAT
eukprot:1147543-Pelagomonas_calceolata.AAC.4